MLSAIFGALTAVFATSGTWLTYLKSANATNIGLKDPLFNLDIGFYIFDLDWYDKLNEIILASVIGLAVVTVIYYAYLLTVRTPDFFNREDDGPVTPEDIM